MDQDGDKSTVNGGAIQDGAFYEYNKSGNTYELIDLSPDADFYGDFTARVATEVLKTGTDTYTAELKATGAIEYKKNSGTATTKAIADSADVIVWTANSTRTNVDFKHITGKQLKALINIPSGGSPTVALGNSNGQLDTSLLGGFTSDVDGLNRASVLAVKYHSSTGELGTAFDNISSNANYGFITKDAIKLSNGMIKFTVWTGSENVEVEAEKSRENDFTKGTIVGYTAINDEDGTNVMTDAVAITSGVTAGSITSVNSKGTKIESSTINLQYDDLDDYSTVLYVDSKAGTGMEDGKATKANSQKVDGTTYYATNLLVYGSEVIVIDVNEIAGKRYGAYTLPSKISGLTDVQWLNTRTNDTDEGAAYEGAIMQLSFYADKDGTLTLTNVADIETGDNDGTVTLSVKGGEYNKFDSLIVTGAGNVVASMNGGGTGSQTKNITIKVNENPNGFKAEDVKASLSGGKLTVQLPLPDGVQRYYVTNMVYVDGVAMGGLGAATINAGMQTWTMNNLSADANNDIVVEFTVTRVVLDNIGDLPAGMNITSNTSGTDTNYTLSGNVEAAKPTDVVNGKTVEDLFDTNETWYKDDAPKYTVITIDRDSLLPSGTVSFKQVNPGFSKLYEESQLTKDTTNFEKNSKGQWVKKHSTVTGNLSLFVCDGDAVTLECYNNSNTLIGTIVFDGSSLNIK